MTEFDILGIDYVLGETRIEVESQMPNFKEAIDKTGIRFVHESKVSNKDLAVSAANKLIERLDFDRQTIDCLLLVTQSSQRRLPSVSAEIQNAIGLRTNLFAIDFNQGCSGFVQALLVAISLLNQFENVLLLTTDTYRDKLDPQDRSTNVIFSDAASATIVARGSNFVLDCHSHFTDGSKSELLMESKSEVDGRFKLFMSGPDIFLWTRKYVAESINSVFQNSEIDSSSRIVIFSHQASKLVIDSLREKIQFKAEFLTNYELIGNTVSSSIPILIADNWKIFTENRSLCVGFGVGLSMSTVLITPTSCMSD